MKVLNIALHALHERAGYPSSRKLQKLIGEDVFSHTKIAQALTQPRLPARGVVELVVREMAGMARPPIGDIEAEVDRFVELWHVADGDASEAVPEDVSHRLEGSVCDPFADPFEGVDDDVDAWDAARRNSSDRAETSHAGLLDQFLGSGGVESRQQTPDDLAGEVIKAAYNAHQGWVELDGHDAERNIDPFAPAEELMAEEWLDCGLGDRRTYRWRLGNLTAALSNLSIHHTIFLSEHPSREELVSVMDQARQFRARRE